MEREIKYKERLFGKSFHDFDMMVSTEFIDDIEDPYYQIGAVEVTTTWHNRNPLRRRGWATAQIFLPESMRKPHLRPPPLPSHPQTHRLRSMRAALVDVAGERQRQEVKWGEQNHPDFSPALDHVVSPVERSHFYSLPSATLARIRCQYKAELGDLAYMDILLEEVCELLEAKDKAELRTELIQVAAVAVDWAEKIDRETAAVGGAA